MARKKAFRPVHPSRRGEFTRKAKAHGMSVQQYASKVRNSPSASTRTKRQAAFVKAQRTWRHGGRSKRKSR